MRVPCLQQSEFDSLGGLSLRPLQFALFRATPRGSMSNLQRERHLPPASDQPPMWPAAHEIVRSHARKVHRLEQARDRRAAARSGYEAHVRVTDDERLVLLPFGRRST